MEIDSNVVKVEGSTDNVEAEMEIEDHYFASGSASLANPVDIKAEKGDEIPLNSNLTLLNGHGGGDSSSEPLQKNPAPRRSTRCSIRVQRNTQNQSNVDDLLMEFEDELYDNCNDSNSNDGSDREESIPPAKKYSSRKGRRCRRGDTDVPKRKYKRRAKKVEPADKAKPSKSQRTADLPLHVQMERNRRARERIHRKLANMTPEELEDYRAKLRFDQVQRKIREKMMSEEEQQRLKQERFVKKMGYLASLPEEVREAQRLHRLELCKRRAQNLSAEERKKRMERINERISNFTPEQLEHHLEVQRRGCKNYQKRLKEKDPERFKAMFHKYRAKQYPNFLQYVRDRVKNETPEERQKRLLRYRINAAKRKVRKQMEEDGTWSEEQIQQRLEQVAEEERNKPPPEVTSAYKPRVGARKPHLKARSSGAVLPVWEAGEPLKGQRLQEKEPKIVRERGKRGRPSKRARFQTDTGEIQQEQGPRNNQVQMPPPPQPLGGFQHINQSYPFPVSTSELPRTLSNSIPAPCMGNLSQSPQSVETPPSVIDVEVKTSNSASPSSYPYPQVATPSLSQQSCHFASSSSPPPSPQDFSEDNDNLNEALSHGDTDPLSPSDLEHFLDASIKGCTESVSSNSHSRQLSRNIETANGTNISPSMESQVEQNTKPVTPSEPTVSLGFICDECGNVYKSRSTLNQHKISQHYPNSTTLSCPGCDITFIDQDALWRHYTHVHGRTQNSQDGIPEKSQNVKKKAPRGTVTDGNYSRGTDEPNECPVCQKRFHQRCTLQDHIRRVHEGKGYFCELCFRDQQSAAKLWRHQVERHGMKDLPPPPGLPMVVCEYCSEVVMRGYKQHLQKKHPEHAAPKINCEKITVNAGVRLKCPHCPSLLVNEYGIMKHIRFKHPTSQYQPFLTPYKKRKPPSNSTVKCTICDKSFPNKWKLDRHSSQVHMFGDFREKLEAKQFLKIISNGKRTFDAECLVCDTHLPTRISVKAHFVAVHHNLLKELPRLALVECSVCQEKFSNGGLLEIHMRTEHVDHLFKCQYCAELKVSEKQLAYHEKRYHFEMTKEDGTGVCFVCKEEFKDKVDVREHMKNSHADSCFFCVTCPKICKSETELAHHSRGCMSTKRRRDREKLFSSEPSDVETFVRIHLKNLRVYCSEVGCDSITQLGKMTLHYHRLHGYACDPASTCEHCGIQIERRIDYVAHAHLVHLVPVDELVQIAPDEVYRNSGRRKRKSEKKLSEDEEDDEEDEDWEQFSKIRSRQNHKAGRSRKNPARSHRRGQSKPESALDSEHLEREKRLIIKVVRLTEAELAKYLPGCNIIIKTEPPF